MNIKVFGKFLFLHYSYFYAALVSAPLNPMATFGFPMPLILAEQSLRHDDIFVFIPDAFFFLIKHLLTRRDLDVIKATGQCKGECNVQQFYILGETLI